MNADTSGMEWMVSGKPVDYTAAVEFMEERVGGIISGNAPELVWCLEHPHCYTKGTSAVENELLLPQNIPVYNTGRGGRFTYHGPGQRVVYVLLDLKRRQKSPDIKLFVSALENWIINVLSDFSIKGFTSPGRTGVWVASGGEERKIAAIGIRLKKWVSYHGVAINVATDMSKFAGIVPCGIKEFGVTSLRELGINAGLENVDQALKSHFPF